MQIVVDNFQNRRFKGTKIILISILFREPIKVSKTSNKVTMNGFTEYTYIVHKQIGAININIDVPNCHILLPIICKLFMHFSYIVFKK